MDTGGQVSPDVTTVMTSESSVLATAKYLLAPAVCNGWVPGRRNPSSTLYSGSVIRTDRTTPTVINQMRLVRSLLAAALVASSSSFRCDVSRSTLALTHSRVSTQRCLPAVAMADGPGDEPEGWTSSDDSMLAHHIAKQPSSARCGRPERVLAGMHQAWVLIFNPGKENEGVYTLQGQQSSVSYVLNFEYKDDADCFASLLHAEGFDEPTPLCWDVSQLSEFCDAGQFEVSLVPQVTTPAPT